MINEEDYDKAIEIINKNDFDNLKNEFPDEELNDQRRCKNCGSTNISKKFLISWIIFPSTLINSNSKEGIKICLLKL